MMTFFGVLILFLLLVVLVAEMVVFFAIQSDKRTDALVRFIQRFRS